MNDDDSTRLDDTLTQAAADVRLMERHVSMMRMPIMAASRPSLFRKCKCSHYQTPIHIYGVALTRALREVLSDRVPVTLTEF